MTAATDDVAGPEAYEISDDEGLPKHVPALPQPLATPTEHVESPMASVTEVPAPEPAHDDEGTAPNLSGSIVVDVELDPSEDSQAPVATQSQPDCITNDVHMGGQKADASMPEADMVNICDSDDEAEASSAAGPHWPGQPVNVVANTMPFRRRQTSYDSLDESQGDAYKRQATLQDEDDGGSTASLEKAFAAVKLTVESVATPQQKNVGVSAPADEANANKKCKYPPVLPPSADDLKTIDEQIADAEPPSYNETGLQAAGGKKRRRRGKQAAEYEENKKFRKAGAADSCGHDDEDEPDEDDEDFDEFEKEQQPAPKKVQAARKKAQAVPKKVPAPKKAPGKKKIIVDEQPAHSVKEPIVQEQPVHSVKEPIVQEQPAHSVKEPIVDEQPAHLVKEPMDKKAMEKKVAADEAKACEETLPSREECEARGAFKPPEHISTNNVYSNSYRQAMKKSNCKQTAKQIARQATAIFKEYGICCPDMVGTFRPCRRQPNKAVAGSKDKQGGDEQMEGADDP